MAHSCPDCFQVCYCGGDMDDILFDEDSEGAIRCTHWMLCDDDDDFDDIYELED